MAGSHDSGGSRERSKRTGRAEISASARKTAVLNRLLKFPRPKPAAGRGYILGRVGREPADTESIDDQTYPSTDEDLDTIYIGHRHPVQYDDHDYQSVAAHSTASDEYAPTSAFLQSHKHKHTHTPTMFRIHMHTHTQWSLWRMAQININNNHQHPHFGHPSSRQFNNKLHGIHFNLSCMNAARMLKNAPCTIPLESMPNHRRRPMSPVDRLHLKMPMHQRRHLCQTAPRKASSQPTSI